MTIDPGLIDLTPTELMEIDGGALPIVVVVVVVVVVVTVAVLVYSTM